MARRKSSFLDDVLELGIKLPWWVSLVLAGASYLLLHHYSQIEIATVTGANDVSESILTSIIKMGSTILQYVIPGLLVGGAFIGFIKRVNRKSIFDVVVADDSGKKLENLSWVEFENLLHQYFIEKGFRVTDTNKGPDGGVDLRLSKDGQAAIVQCKHWRASKVGVSVIREQYGIMAAEGVDRSFVITSGKFTHDAKSRAKDKAIELVDGKQLRKLLGHAELLPTKDWNVQQAPETSCPRCGTGMVLRTAKRGKNTGARFWGCKTYPKCRGTRDFS